MTTVSRRVAATPVRLASDAWQCIIDLFAPTNHDARAEMSAIVGIASSLITAEAMKSSPIIASGEGPQVRVYCVYGDDAIDGSKVNEVGITGSPVDQGDSWKMSLPCSPDDLEWVRASLRRRTTRITARNMSETTLAVESSDDNAAACNVTTIDVESFLRP